MNRLSQLWNFILNGDRDTGDATWSQEKPDTEAWKMTLFVINNPDGSPRWIFPEGLKSPLFLKFYPASTFRSKVIKFIFKVMFYTGLIRLYAKQTDIYIGETKPHFLNWLSKDMVDFTFFGGTVGPNQKIILYQKLEDGSGLFSKIPYGKAAFNLVKNESEVLRGLEHRQSRQFASPEVISFVDGVLTIKDITMGNHETTFSTPYINAIESMYSDVKEEEILDSPVPEYLNSMPVSIKHKDVLLLKEQLNSVYDLILKKKIRYKIGFGHGDFTSWNVGIKHNKVNVLDWELGGDYPLLFDAFHFMIQNEIMLTDHTSDEIMDMILDKMLSADMIALSDKFDLDWKKQFIAYLLYVGSYYCKIYAEQDKLHYQAQKAMQVWVKMLDWVLSYLGGESNRTTFLKEFFQKLNTTPYALMKNSNLRIDEIKDSSDVDLFIEKKDSRGILNWVNQHKDIIKCRIDSRSYMSVVTVFFKDGSFLSIDFIFKLKRRYLEYLDVGDIIKNTSISSEGVRLPHIYNDIEYIILFYLLNNTYVPDKYLSYFKNQQKSQIEDIIKYLNANLKLDVIEYTSFFDKEKVKPIILDLKRHVNSRISNRRVSGIYNKIVYIKDTMKNRFQGKGMIITFSGVDGAGKSTIISHIKELLETKFRKKVIVLRHRPSILPIMSAWVYGKAEAEAKSVSTLPRTGNNKSIISSLLRFGYYFLDYLFGQFVIWIKYTLPGHIVIYDRYYFDFIEDPVRSNISLPRWFTKFFYRFVFKPNINVFLYAQPELILSRKKELSKDDIIKLTSAYKHLFEEYSGKYNGRYVAIENNSLDKTVEHIESLFIATA